MSNVGLNLKNSKGLDHRYSIGQGGSLPSTWLTPK